MENRQYHSESSGNGDGSEISRGIVNFSPSNLEARVNVAATIICVEYSKHNVVRKLWIKKGFH
jgi:hypothetical protein